MQGYGNANKIVKELNEQAKYLLRSYYAGSFSQNTESFQYLIQELRWTWGLSKDDKSEDVDILNYLDKKKEIESMERNYYNYVKLDILTIETEYIPRTEIKTYMEEKQSYELGSKLYKYILEHPKNNIIFKIIKTRHEDIYDFGRRRNERIDCYIFKEIKEEQNYANI